MIDNAVDKTLEVIDWMAERGVEIKNDRMGGFKVLVDYKGEKKEWASYKADEVEMVGHVGALLSAKGRIECREEKNDCCNVINALLQFRHKDSRLAEEAEIMSAIWYFLTEDPFVVRTNEEVRKAAMDAVEYLQARLQSDGKDAQ